ncbi:MAG: phosphoribosylglycinamide formyltransferase [Candidatus Omnitrophota bacterium]
MENLKNIAVLASGNGSNFQAIVEAVKRGKIKAQLKLLVSDNPEAYCLQRAAKAKVKAFIADRRDFSAKGDFEEQIILKLKSEKIGLIVLAGFMRLLSAEFIRKYRGRILNIHPSLLPAFKGARAIKDAFDYGAKVSGVTVHFVDEETDHGPIILQEPLKIKTGWGLKELEKNIHSLEHKIYPRAISLFLKGRLRLEGRKVRILKP